MFFTCVALQNMIQNWDRETGQLRTWEVDADDGSFDDGDGSDRFWFRPRLRKKGKFNEYFTPKPNDDFSEFGTSSFPVGVERGLFSQEPGAGEKARYAEKQKKLVAHFKHASAAHEVQWLRS